MPIDLIHQGLESAPKHVSMPYTDTDNTIKRMYQLIKGPRGEQSLVVRLAVEEVIRGVSPRDRLSQLVAIYHWFDSHYHFINDPNEVELVKDPTRLVQEIQQKGVAIGDCDDASVFLATTPRTLGIQTSLVRTGFRDSPKGRASGPFTHVMVVAQDQYGRKIVLDPVAGKKSREMLGRVKQVKW